MRALASGELRATKDNFGRWSIDPIALDDWLSMRRTGERHQPSERVDMPAFTSADTPVVTSVTPPAALHVELERIRDERDASQLEAAGLRAENVQLRERLIALSEDRDRDRERNLDTLTDLRRRLDQEQEERRSLQRQLTPPAQLIPQPAQDGTNRPLAGAEPLKASRGFLARLLGL